MPRIMFFMAFVMAGLALAELALARPALACQPPSTEAMQAHLDAVNAERARARLPQMVHSPVLSRMAQAHACDMARRGFFGHTSPDGGNLADRARQAGLRGRCYLGENIAQGQRDLSRVIADWMRSPGHRANILNRDYRQVGFGYATGARWVQVFASNC
ncbi:MAG: CAP domain-containing protein [Roseinatronobacter sp.]